MKHVGEHKTFELAHHLFKRSWFPNMLAKKSKLMRSRGWPLLSIESLHENDRKKEAKKKEMVEQLLSMHNNLCFASCFCCKKWRHENYFII